MKFIHTSDWHLGRMLYGRSLLPDQEHFIRDFFLPLVKREHPAAVLLAGDVYDRSVAPAAAIKLFDETVSQLAEWEIPLIVISGNHDGADRMAIGASVLRKHGILIAARPQDCFTPWVLEQGGETAQIFTMPWLDVPTARQLLGEEGEGLRTTQECTQAIVRRMEEQFLPGAAHVLVSHYFVAGSALSDSESPIFVGGSDQVFVETFQPFDYVALGHLHGPQRVGETGRYSGSPLWYSVDEEHQKKSVSIVNVHPGNFTVQEERVVPLRWVRRIKGPFDEILQAGKTSPSEDLLDITLTDDHPVYLPAKQLQPYYPNLLSIHSQWLLRQQEDAGIQAIDARSASRQEVFSRFMKDVCGEEAAPEDLAVLEEVLRDLHLIEGGEEG